MKEKKTICRREFIKTGAISSAGFMASGSSFASALRGLGPLDASHEDAARVAGASGVDNDALAAGFQVPPASAKPHTWWHWMDGNVTKVGITADLEAMNRIGLGGVHIFNVDYQISRGPVKYATPEWLEMIQFAAQEASRLGLEVGLHNCSGWSSSGGPWITPDQGMQKVVWTEMRVKGPSSYKGTLLKPKVTKYEDYFRDIAVLACKTPASEHTTLQDANPKLSTSNGSMPAQPINQFTDSLDITFSPPSDEKPHFILLEFDKPFAARSFLIDYTSGHGDTHCDLQISDDGKEFKTVASTIIKIKGQPSVAFSDSTARFYRILLTGKPADATPTVITAIDLLNGYRLPDWPTKAGFAEFRAPYIFEPLWDETSPKDTAYQRKETVDLSVFFNPDGELEWDVPEGDWTIFRFGYAPNGRPNTHPEVPWGIGLEVDKMSRPALDLHFDNVIKAVLKEMGPLTGKSFTTLLIDSYEVGPQNWTPKFREEFQRLRGYDPLPYMLAFTGRVVDSNEITERYLWDIRRTIADLYAENYYGYFSDLCHQRGLRAAFEPYSGPFDIMGCGDSADLPMGEFWTGGGYRRTNSRNRQVVSSAHLGGKAIVGAESYTSSYGADKYTLDPYSLKTLGDFQFCEGINRFIFHRYALQPWLDKRPGMTMGPWGLHFERTVTWWEQGRSWIEYITRCQYLLQSGKPVAEILCFTGEDAQAQAHWGKDTTPAIPEGYDYEFINVPALLSATVRGNRIALSNGLTYAVVVLPDARYLTPVVAEKLLVLTKAGATIIGPLPNRSPSLSNYPACDAAVRNAAAELWGGLDGESKTGHAVGSGKVFWGKSLGDVLAADQVSQDFSFTSADPQTRLAYKHRVTEGADIYFVSNQRAEFANISCSFHISGKAPELWRPDTGILEAAPIYKDAGGRVTIPLELDPAGSVFVVFRNASATDHAVGATRDGIAEEAAPSLTTPNIELHAKDNLLILNAWSAGNYQIRTARGRRLHARVASISAPLILNEGWNVGFPPELGAPASIALGKLLSLSQHDVPGVRYFSGTATYSREFDIRAEAMAASHEFYLDLGTVKHVAEVRINGKHFGVLWKTPFRTCITSALQSGKNHLEVRITNVWANRLIGDEQLPDDREWIAIAGRGSRLKKWPEWMVKNQPRPSQRIAFSTWKFYAKDDPLPDSGLIGPVQLLTLEKISFKLS